MEKTEYKDIDVQIGQQGQYPIMHTITAAEQKDFVESGYGTVQDLISDCEGSYRCWQSDC